MNTTLLRTRALAAVLATSFVLPSVALATPEKAAEYYSQASAAYQRGDLREASDLLERAYAEDPDLVYQYNRVLALEGLKDYEEALRLLNIYGDPMTRDARARFTDVDDIRKRLEDGLALQKKLEEEQKAKDAQKKEEPPIEEPPPVKAQESHTPWLAVGLLAGGGVALGAGALFGSGLLVSDQLDDTQCVKDNLDLGASGSAIFADCPYEDIPTYNAQRNAYNDDVASIETQQTLAIVFLGAGTLLAVGGIVAWVLDDGGESNSTAQITPYVGADGGGATFHVSF
ncbi:MAG: hypothetical protein R3E66_04010 [bacterium]